MIYALLKYHKLFLTSTHTHRESCHPLHLLWCVFYEVPVMVARVQWSMTSFTEWLDSKRLESDFHNLCAFVCFLQTQMIICISQAGSTETEVPCQMLDYRTEEHLLLQVRKINCCPQWLWFIEGGGDAAGAEDPCICRCAPLTRPWWKLLLASSCLLLVHLRLLG